jgi:hypothetical protein
VRLLITNKYLQGAIKVAERLPGGPRNATSNLDDFSTMDLGRQFNDVSPALKLAG